MQFTPATAKAENCKRVCLANARNRTEKNTERTTLYKRNAGFIAKFNISSSNKNSCKMKVSSLKIRTTLILDRSAQSSLTTFDEKECCHSKAKEPKKPDQRPVLKATGQPEVVVTKCSQ